MPSFCSPWCHFNPRTHEECDVQGSNILIDSGIFQSTHSRGVRPVGLSTTNSNYKISIHALTGSATKKRVTYGIQNNNFNPRTHGECDIYHDNILWLNLIISIHAPARGATRCLWRLWRIFRHFNPRTREGCDLCLKWMGQTRKKFQSTHPRGVRPMLEMNGPDEEEISIHALTGSATCTTSSWPLQIGISIHALTGSATKLYMGVTPDKYISIHALTGSATCTTSSWPLQIGISIHALTGSATYYHMWGIDRYEISIHALTGSATRKTRRVAKIHCIFQSTHSRGVRQNLPQVNFYLS